MCRLLLLLRFAGRGRAAGCKTSCFQPCIHTDEALQAGVIVFASVQSAGGLPALHGFRPMLAPIDCSVHLAASS